jgi:hypothetical protein
MIDVNSIYTDTDAAHRRLIALAMFVVWFGVVCFLAWTHLVWRDEVRAIAGRAGRHGEGHPVVWYLLALRLIGRTC